MPQSVFVTMALEAANQVQFIDDIQESSILLAALQFPDSLPLLSLRAEDGMIETSFDLRRTEKKNEFTFDISGVILQSGSHWKQCCSGKVRFVSHKVNDVITRNKPINHDLKMLNYIESFTTVPRTNLDDLNIEGNHAEGSFKGAFEDDESYRLPPFLLNSLMRIPSILALGSGLPADYQILSIGSIQVPAQFSRFEDGNFDVDLTRLGPTRCTSDLQIRAINGNCISFQGIQSKLHHLVQRKVPLQSLFYKPEVLQDITYLDKSDSFNLSDLVELVTHKWPMSDIGIVDLPVPDSTMVISHLAGMHSYERPRFRSLNIISDEQHSDLGRVRTFKSFPADQQLHILFGSVRGIISEAAHVQRDGFVCTSVSNAEEEGLFDDNFDLVCEINRMPSSTWVLGRPKTVVNSEFPTPKLNVFSTGEFAACLDKYGNFEFTQLEKGKTISHFPDEMFDLIVLDCGKDSMLTTWAGADLLLWIQSALEHVDNLLWVTNQLNANPFNNVTGSFLRTVQSEHPSMKVASLVFQDNTDDEFFGRTVFRVHDRMVHGSNEVELLAYDGKICALRYLPDDALSASVGLAPPRTLSANLKLNNYEASLVASGKVELICSRFKDLEYPPDGFATVAIVASIIDHRDVVYFIDTHAARQPLEGLGQFFVGKVLSKGTPAEELDGYVVGFQVGSHKSQVLVSLSQIQKVPGNISAADAVAEYAATATALAVVDGTARARRGETLSTNVSGILRDALKQVCQNNGVIFEESEETETDFMVTFDTLHGLLVNGNTVSVEGFMLQKSYPVGGNTIFAEPRVLRNQVTTFQLDDLQKAFEIAVTLPLGIVLDHQGLEHVNRALISYKTPSRLFREDAAYIIVGGLGGLGRYVCLWMIANGAKHLVTISRSGLASEEARATVRAIEALGAEIQVFQADASDAKAIDQAMTQVRRVRPIKGCLNMVLVLENSPLMTMKPDQWDRALRTKVDSTWNLHESTLSDDLDMFIMFSSISSISGNRTQANYATGNAFQNSMAVYRRSLGLPGIAIALGAMSGIGVLANDHDLLRTLSQSGMQAVDAKDLAKIMEAAVFESYHAERSLLAIGFEMFETLDGIVQSKPEQNQLFWTESPEFGFLLDHKFSTTGLTKVLSLREQLSNQEGAAAYNTLLQAFLVCLSNVLGYDISAFDAASSLASYGLDSLNAVSCRYWFFKRSYFLPLILK